MQDLPNSEPESAVIPEPGEARPGEVVLTGATGFIGRRVVQSLVAQDNPVTAVTRRLHSLPPEILQPAREGKLRIVKASLTDATELRQAFKGASVCIHLATGGGDTWEEVEAGMDAFVEHPGDEHDEQAAGDLRHELGVERHRHVGSSQGPRKWWAGGGGT